MVQIISKIDTSILHYFQRLRTPAGNQLFIWITELGNGGALWIGIAAGLCLLKETRKAGLLVLAALCVDLLLVEGLIKPIAARPRPFIAGAVKTILIPPPSGYSFPSGHAASSFAAASVLSRFFKNAQFLWIAAALIALSRLYLGVHYPSDVLAGGLLGIGIGQAVLLIASRQKKSV